MEHARYENGVVYDRPDCCSNWTARVPVESIVKVGGYVYKLNANGTRYESYSTYFSTQIDFPGEDVVLYDPANQYTNYTCRDFSCRSVVVFRNLSNATARRCTTLYDNGDCVDYTMPTNPFLDPPLCHNSSASKCVIWVPIDVSELGGDAGLYGVIACVSVLGAVVVLTVLLSMFQERTYCFDVFMMIVLLVYLLTLSLLTTIGVWRFEKWTTLTGVDLDYATYQTCMIECATKANMYIDMAMSNQCEDLGTSCAGAPSLGDTLPCRGCQQHSGDWHYIAVYNEFVRTAIIVQWLVVSIYAMAMSWSKTNNYGAYCCVVLPFAVLVVLNGVINAKVTAYGAHGVTTYSSLTQTALLADVGQAWTICGSVWMFLFVFGKAVDIGMRMQHERVRRNSGGGWGIELVFCR
jgi:hypothetical protein